MTLFWMCCLKTCHPSDVIFGALVGIAVAMFNIYFVINLPMYPRIFYELPIHITGELTHIRDYSETRQLNQQREAL